MEIGLGGTFGSGGHWPRGVANLTRWQAIGPDARNRYQVVPRTTVIPLAKGAQSGAATTALRVST